VKPVSRGIDRIAVTFDDPNLVANAGLLLVATLVSKLGLESLCSSTIRLSGDRRLRPGPKDLDPGARHGGGGHAHRPRRHVARRRHGQGVAPPGDGTVDARDVPACFHLRSRPSVRKGDR
jgi:hypothetical protein